MPKKSSKSGKGKGSKKLSFLERLVIKITIPSKITREVIKRDEQMNWLKNNWDWVVFIACVYVLGVTVLWWFH
ncbi:hypothetical protein ES703_99197 [subsurface metagenome]